MKNIVSLDNKPNAGTILMQFATIMLVVLGCAAIFSFLGVYIAMAIEGLSLRDMADLNESSSLAVINANRILQLISTIGIFLVPAFAIPMLLFKTSPIRFLSLNRSTPVYLFIMALFAYYALTPAMEWVIQFNQNLHLPAALKGLDDGIRSLEDKAELATKALLKMPTFGSFIFTVFLIALLPAIAEELFFRGLVQRTVFNWTRKIHLSILLTAMFFSFIHFQFLGFLPRMLLGMLLGYLLYWSGDIKLSIFIHFLNNFTAVAASYEGQIKNIDIDPDKINFHPYLIFFSLIIGAIILYGIYKGGLRKKEERRASEEESESILPAREDINWVKIHSTPNQYEAEIMTGTLKNEGIMAVIVNKKESSYNIFGRIEIYVPEEEVVKAKEILESNLEAEQDN